MSRTWTLEFGQKLLGIIREERQKAMVSDLWGYIHIECDEFPSALIQKGALKDTGWASYKDAHRGYWLNLESEPWGDMEVSLQEAQQQGLIEDFSFHPYTAEELASRWS